MSKRVAIGIDLGTTNCCVAICRDDKVEIIFDNEGNNVTPSCVSFMGDERIFGEQAKERIVIDPENTIYDTKRLMGRRFDDAVVQEDIKHWSFQVVNRNGNPMIAINNDQQKATFRPEEIAGMILSNLKQRAEVFLGEKVTDVVVTVPAYFDDSQRSATLHACKLAGLSVLRILAEPTAAALAYGTKMSLKQDKIVMVYDLGGGTFDISLVKISDDKYEVKAVNGDSHLGGNDFDYKLVQSVMSKFKKKHESASEPSIRKIRRLWRRCEKAKKTLTFVKSAKIDLVDFARDSNDESIDLQCIVTRSEFEIINEDVFKKTIDAVEATLEEAKINKQDIDEVILVGGSTRIPKIKSMLEKFFDGKALHVSLNPDEAVAYGAAVQAAALIQSGSARKNLQLVDVTPFSLGVRVVDGSFSIIIEKNSPIPTEKTLYYGTAEDNQTAVDINIYEGEHQLKADNNTHLATFTLENLRRRPAGEVEIAVTFKIDKNGVFHAKAVDTLSGKCAIIEISYYRGRMTDEEIESASVELRAKLKNSLNVH